MLLCDNHGVSWVLCVKKRQINIKDTWSIGIGRQHVGQLRGELMGGGKT
jgi:hypothetical protein